MIVTISGDLGSGKSTVAKLLAQQLDYSFFSTGDFMTEIAKERGVSLLELSEIAKEDATVDKRLDQKQVSFGQEHSNVVLDSRLGWYFIPDSVKVYLTVELEEAAKRIFEAARDDEKENFSIDATMENIIQRKESERLRYKKYYDLVYDDPKNFQLILDTTQASPEEISERIMQLLKEQGLMKQ